MIVLVLLTHNVYGQLNAQTTDAENDGDDVFKYPRGFYQFTVEVPPLKEDCFFQHVAQGTNMLFAFEVR